MQPVLQKSMSSAALGVQQAALNRDHYRLGSIVGPQFQQNLLDVHLDGVVGHEEQICDLFVAFSL